MPPTLRRSGWPPLSRTHCMTAAAAPLRICRPPSRSTPLIRVWAVNATKCAVRQLARVPLAQAVRGLGQHDDRAALRGLVGQAGQLGGVGQLGVGRRPATGMNSAACRLPRVMVPVLSSSRVFTSPAASTARPRHGQHVVLHQPVHAGDADRREQRADGGRDQADQQGDQDDRATARRRRRSRTAAASTVASRKTMVRLASRMFSAISFGVFCRDGALDQGDHPVDEALAGLGGDLDDDPVGQHLGAAGDRAAVAAGLADHRGGLAGDRRLVDAGDTLDDVAVAGDDLARPRRRPGRRACSAGAGDLPPRRRRRAAAGRSVSVLARRSVAACALPRPSATASARLANTTVSHSQTTTDQTNTLGSVKASTVDEHGADLDDEHHRVLHHHPRVELAQRVRQRASAASSGRTARDACRRRRRCVRGASFGADGAGSRSWSQSFRERAERERGEVGQAGDDEDDADEHRRRTAAGGWAGCPRSPAPAAAGPGSRPGQHQHDRQEPAEQHREAERGVVEVGVRATARRRREPLLLPAEVKAYRTSEKPCGPRVEDRRLGPRQGHRDRRCRPAPARRGQDVQRDQLDLARGDLLAQVLRGAARPSGRRRTP